MLWDFFSWQNKILNKAKICQRSGVGRRGRGWRLLIRKRWKVIILSIWLDSNFFERSFANYKVATTSWIYMQNVIPSTSCIIHFSSKSLEKVTLGSFGKMASSHWLKTSRRFSAKRLFDFITIFPIGYLFRASQPTFCNLYIGTGTHAGNAAM